MKGRRGWCNHYNGLTNKQCDAGVEYDSVATTADVTRSDGTTHPAKRFPCFAEGQEWHGDGPCGKCQMPTEEEIAEQEASASRKFDLLRKGLSDCCEAPVDESRVIKEGRHKGHGRRYCSKCGKCLFVV